MFPTNIARLSTTATPRAIYDALWRKREALGIDNITPITKTDNGSNIIIETIQGEMALTTYEQSNGVRVTSLTIYATTPDQHELDPNGEVYQRIVEFIDTL